MKQHLRGWLAGTAWLLAAAAGACGSTAEPAGNGTTTSPVGGTATPGTAGTPGSSAVAGSGTTKPTTTGAGAAATGTAGAAASAAAGSTASAAGAGTGMAGAAAAGGNNMSCGAASTLPGPMLHDMAKAVLLPKMDTPTAPCAFSSCHSDKTKKAQLVLDLTVTDLKTALVGKAACEAPNLKLVDGSGGDAALAKSWLWLKLVAPADASSILTPEASWGTPGSCGQMGMDYGMRMPFGAGMLWEQNKLDAIKAWICAGAPGAM